MAVKEKPGSTVDSNDTLVKIAECLDSLSKVKLTRAVAGMSAKIPSALPKVNSRSLYFTGNFLLEFRKETARTFTSAKLDLSTGKLTGDITGLKPETVVSVLKKLGNDPQFVLGRRLLSPDQALWCFIFVSHLETTDITLNGMSDLASITLADISDAKIEAYKKAYLAHLIEILSKIK